MSDVAIGAASDGGGGAFRFRTVVILIAVGVAVFIAAMLVSAYAPNNSAGGNQAHALSNAAVGYSGIVRLTEAAGDKVRVIRDDSRLRGPGLVVATPPTAATPMGNILTARGDLPVLVVLPKWATMADPRRPSWAVLLGLLPRSEPEGVLAPASKLTVGRTRSGGRPLVAVGDMPAEAAPAIAPRPLQYFSGEGVEPLITDTAGHVVLGRLPGDALVYILSDPDLLDNLGMRDRRNAAAAVAMLEALDQNGEGVDFDVTLLGLGRQKSPLRLAFDPPFLAMTLAVFAAMLLAGWQAFARFGPVARRERAIAFGKRALIDNSALLVRKAGRQLRMGPRYVEVIRDRAVTAFGVPARLRDGAIDDYLDGLDGKARFTDLVREIDAADDRTSLVAAARALHDWQRENGK